MDKYIPTFTDISDWYLQVHLNTGGSRSKKIAINPATNDEFFFKGSKITPQDEIRYPMEFWSEIASSKIGQYLGFNILDYNIAYRSDQTQKVGCISKSMVKYSENRLTEGKSYLVGYDTYYNPKKDKKNYTFQFICKSLEYFKLSVYIPNLVETLVFDAIVSNSDRHQENWGIINKFYETKEIEIFKKIIGKFPKIGLRLVKYILKNLTFIKQDTFKMFIGRIYLKFGAELALHEFSPIYDSGCCLGREKDEAAIKVLLGNDSALQKYIKQGVAEVYWEGNDKKLNHFELIKHLQKEYVSIINDTIGRIQKKYNEGDIRILIFNLDKNLPSNLAEYKLPDLRKELMVKLITLRVQKLNELLWKQ